MGGSQRDHELRVVDTEGEESKGKDGTGPGALEERE